MDSSYLQIKPPIAAILSPSIDISAPLTPDALMSFCESRLRGLDEQIQASFYKQQLANRDSARLTSLAGTLTPPSNAVDLSCEGGLECALDAAQKMLAAADTMEDPTTRDRLVEAANKLIDRVQQGHDYDIKNAFSVGKTPKEMAAAMSGDKVSATIDPSAFKSLTADAVQGIQKDLNSSAELSMINLQSLMSQRQSSVQLITNMVQSLGDQLNKIAANVGH